MRIKKMKQTANDVSQESPFHSETKKINFFFRKLIIGFKSRRERTFGYFSHLIPKFYENVFLFVGSTTLGNFS